MKIKYIKESSPQIDLTPAKEYEALSVEKTWYRIIDDSGEDYLYPPELFEEIK